MPKVGDGYVEIKPDFSSFGAAFDAEMKGKLAGVGAAIGEHIKKNVHIDVDIDRNRLSRLGEAAAGDIAKGISSASGAISGALQSVTSAVSSALSQLPVVGTAFSALGEGGLIAAPAIAALGVALASLAASFGAAVAGAGALAIGLAGALGPVALVAIAAVARLTEIFKAMSADGKASASSVQAVAAAQDQLNAASASVATAQQNLRDQTTAAYRAWHDSIQTVTDDLLGVKDAQQGIIDANLSTREAEQALKDFKKQAGAAGDAFDQVFKKFSDVNVDTSGLKGALLGAADVSGTALSGDQELKLERLINNVRDAKLREQHATATLGDSTRKLARDRQTEAKFAADGIRAYPGYTNAVHGLASAQRSLEAAQRASAAATVKQGGELAKLSPIERTLAGTFKVISDKIEEAFSPALNAVFGGLNRSLKIFSGVLTDPKVIGALRNIGVAMGGVLVTLARTFAGPKMRDAFVTLANGGARLVTILGSRVFVAFTDLLTSIATAALPAVLDLVGKIADVFDRWATWIDKHPKQFKADIDSLIGSFKTWGTVLIDVVGLTYKVGAALRPIGDAIIGAFARPSAALGAFGKSIGLTKTDLHAAGDAFRTVGHAIGVIFAQDVRTAARVVAPVLATIVRLMTHTVETIDALAHGDWTKAWRSIRRVPIDLINGLLTILRGLGKSFTEVGGILGKAFGKGLHGALDGIKTLGRAVVNDLIGAVNAGIRTVNKVLGPRDLGPFGHTPDLRIGEIDKIGQRGTGVTIHTRRSSSLPASPGDAGRFNTRGGPVTNNIVIRTVGGGMPDGRFVGDQIMRELSRVGG